MVNCILRLPAVIAGTGLSRSSIYARVADGSFPQPISLGGRAIGWLESEINDWIETQIAASRASKAAWQTSRATSDAEMSQACPTGTNANAAPRSASTPSLPSTKPTSARS